MGTGIDTVRGWFRVEPGGVSFADEAPGIQPNERIEVRRSFHPDSGERTLTETVFRGRAPDEPGFYDLGTIWPGAPDVAADHDVRIEAGPNYQADTAGHEPAAGTEGTPTDPIADVASRATNGRSNDGHGLVDSSGGSVTDVAGLSTAAVVAVVAAVAVLLFGGN